MKTPSPHSSAHSKIPTPVKTSTMKRVGPPMRRKAPTVVSQADNDSQLIEALRQRVNDLETRLAELESVITLQNQDVIISAPKSVLIQGVDTVEISATQFKVAAALSESNAAIAKFSGLVQCETIQANTVMGTTYTPGAGNIW